MWGFSRRFQADLGGSRGLQGPPGGSRRLQAAPGPPPPKTPKNHHKHGFERTMRPIAKALNLGEAEISRGMVRPWPIYTLGTLIFGDSGLGLERRD